MTGKTTPDPLLRKAQEEVSRAVVALVQEEPFYGHVLSGVNRDFGHITNTAAVSFRNGRPLLSVAPEFFIKKLTRKKERVAVIKHEVLHLILDHLGRVDWKQIHPRIYNLAADIVVNQFVGRKWTLPSGAITLDSFDFVLPPDMTTDWYYKELMKRAMEMDNDMQSSHSDHSGWKVDPTAQGISRHELGRLLKSARDRCGKDYGRVPDPLKNIIDAFIQEMDPTIDWRRVLRMFSNSSRKTRIASTLRRPSKRYGTYPGIKVKRHHRMAVILDTSGSVDDDLVAEFFAEVHGIWRQGSEITVIEADERVQQVYEYAGKLPTKLGGRGGTFFDPALQYVADAVRPYDAAIYLTDGFAAAPTVIPRCKVLWVLPHSGSADALNNQKVIRIER